MVTMRTENPTPSEFNVTINILKKSFFHSLKDINPWAKIRNMHTNVMQDVLKQVGIFLYIGIVGIHPVGQRPEFTAKSVRNWLERLNV
jgi:hypothetical protein